MPKTGPGKAALQIDVSVEVREHIRKKPHQGHYIETLVRADMGRAETLEERITCLELRQAQRFGDGPLIDVVRADKLEEYLLTADKKNEFIVCSEAALSMDQVERIRQKWKAARGM
jgi:hypothetical protein